MGKLNNDNNGFGGVELLLAIVIVVLLGVVGWFVYKDHNKTTTAKVATVIKTVTKTTAATSSSTSTSTTSTTSVFKIPELGIEVTVPNSIKNIVYNVDPSGTLSTGQTYQSVTLSTQTLTSLDANCSVNGSAPPLGTIFKTTGQYPSSADFNPNDATGGLIKQHASYYIGWNSPQAACGTLTSTQDEAGVDTNLFSTALKDSVQPIE
jgi:cytoskeletal protein RodZ